MWPGNRYGALMMTQKLQLLQLLAVSPGEAFADRPEHSIG
jgi:hypothetical protein